MVFWRRRNNDSFRDVDSFDEESVLPVKVTYFEDDTTHVVNGSESGNGTGTGNFDNKDEINQRNSLKAQNSSLPQKTSIMGQQLGRMMCFAETPGEEGFDITSSVSDSKNILDITTETEQHYDLPDGSEQVMHRGMVEKSLIDEELIDDENEERQVLNRRRIVGTLFFLLVIGVCLVIAAIVVRTKKEKSSDKGINFEQTQSPTVSPTIRLASESLAPSVSAGSTGSASPSDALKATMSPTSAPTLWLGQPENIPIWLSVLSPVTDSTTFVPGAPQTSALKWISSEDSLQLDPSARALSNMIERYVLAVLFYATRGNTWSEELNFLSGDSICSWNDGASNGITCDENSFVKKIFIVGNSLLGTIPSELNHLVNLESLDLYFNELTGSIPALDKLTALQHIDLDGNSLQSSVPSSLFNLPAIKRIFLLNNPKLTGPIPEIVNDFSPLERISFYGCSLSGELPSSLSRATNLSFVQFFNNRLSGTIPSQLADLPKLQLFSLRGNDLVGDVPTFAGQTTLETISLGENRLGGQIPTTIVELSGLKLLYLQGNELSGEVPATMNLLQNLEQVWLFDNDLEGTMPSFAASTGTLEQVFMGNNQFSGPLQSFLEKIPKSIQFLDIGNNHDVTGSLPGVLSTFDSLIHFNVSSTGLTGSIPSEIATLDLRVFSIEGTNISGDLSTLICESDGLTLPDTYTTLSANCGSAPAQVLCPCCTKCCLPQADSFSLICTDQ